MVENLENLVADTSENPELLTTFRYKLKLPRAEQLQLLVQSLGCQRWVYNQALAVQENRVESSYWSPRLTPAKPAPNASIVKKQTAPPATTSFA